MKPVQDKKISRTICLPASLWNEIERLARKDERSMSSYVYVMIRKIMDENADHKNKDQ